MPVYLVVEPNPYELYALLALQAVVGLPVRASTPEFASKAVNFMKFDQILVRESRREDPSYAELFATIRSKAPNTPLRYF